MRNKYTQEKKDEIVAYYLKSGLARAKVEKKFGLGATTLRNWLPKTTKPSNGKRFSKATKKEAVKQYIAGASQQSLADKYGCSTNSIAVWVRQSKAIREDNVLVKLCPEHFNKKRKLGEELLIQWDKYHKIVSDAETNLNAINIELTALGVTK